nr:unnamed protein product [Callosobruchus analis]
MNFLLGDNVYANNNYLLTPIVAPNTAEERRYNKSHIKTRNLIERLFKVLKRRFPILSYGCRLKFSQHNCVSCSTTQIEHFLMVMVL